MKPCDVIRHTPSGETWTVAAPSPDGKYILCCGWPETMAPVKDCVMMEPATDDEARTLARQVIEGCPHDLRGSWARQWLESKESPNG